MTELSKRIIFQMPGSPVTILAPCECGLTVDQIAKKDTPTGVAYWIVYASEVEVPMEIRDALEISPEAGEPDGYGD